MFLNLARMACLAVLLLGGCLVIPELAGEVRVSRTGEMGARLEGTFLHVTLLEAIRSGGPQDEIQKAVDDTLHSLQGISEFKSVNYVGNAEFRFDYRRFADLSKSSYVTMFSRNNALIRLQKDKDDPNEVTLTTQGATPKQVAVLRELRHDINVVFSFATDAEVTGTNATERIDGRPEPGWNTWVWRSDGLSVPLAFIKFRLDRLGG